MTASYIYEPVLGYKDPRKWMTMLTCYMLIADKPKVANKVYVQTPECNINIEGPQLHLHQHCTGMRIRKPLLAI
jgi:hypothetical protein